MELIANLAVAILAGDGCPTAHTRADVDACNRAVAVITTPCPTEDSLNCYWNAERGNSIGRSFIAVGTEADHIIVFVED